MNDKETQNNKISEISQKLVASAKVKPHNLFIYRAKNLAR